MSTGGNVMSEPGSDKLTKALNFFKDWSNYLLVTTVAALGWVGKGAEFSSHSLKLWCIWLFALSVVFGIFTLALIPLVQEQRTTQGSNYDVDAQFRVLFWTRRLRLKRVCLPQHVLFLAGIIVYAWGTK